MATTTFQGVVRSAGGDGRKVVSPGSMMMSAPFHIADPTAAATTRVTRSPLDDANLVLPANAVVISITVDGSATGGASPTFDLGSEGYNDGTSDPDALINEGAADGGKMVFNFASAEAGDSMAAPLSATQPVYITGGVGASAPTGGTITGIISYFVSDDGKWDK